MHIFIKVVNFNYFMFSTWSHVHELIHFRAVMLHVNAYYINYTGLCLNEISNMYAPN